MSKPVRAATPLPIQAALGNYDVLRRLATGGMGEVFLARQRGAAAFRRDVVLKRLHQNLMHDPRFVQIVGELSLVSDRFRRLWARHDVHTREGAMTVAQHPEVGELRLFKERLVVEGADDLVLVMYHPADDHDTTSRLATLCSSAA